MHPPCLAAPLRPGKEGAQAAGSAVPRPPEYSAAGGDWLTLRDGEEGGGKGKVLELVARPFSGLGAP